MSFWIGQNTTNFVIFDIGYSIMHVKHSTTCFVVSV